MSVVDFPHKETVTWAIDVSLLSVWKKTAEETLDWPVIRDAKTVIWRRRNGVGWYKIMVLLVARRRQRNVFMHILNKKYPNISICSMYFQYFETSLGHIMALIFFSNPNSRCVAVDNASGINSNLSSGEMCYIPIYKRPLIYPLGLDDVMT